MDEGSDFVLALAFTTWLSFLYHLHMIPDKGVKHTHLIVGDVGEVKPVSTTVSRQGQLEPILHKIQD